MSLEVLQFGLLMHSCTMVVSAMLSSLLPLCSCSALWWLWLVYLNLLHISLSSHFICLHYFSLVMSDGISFVVFVVGIVFCPYLPSLHRCSTCCSSVLLQFAFGLDRVYSRVGCACTLAIFGCAHELARQCTRV